MIRIKRTLLLFTLSILSISAFAQQVDSTVIDGKKIYIYPFKQGVKMHQLYFPIVKPKAMIEFTFANFKDEIKMNYGNEFDEAQLNRLYRDISRSSKSYAPKYARKRKFKKAARKNPYPLLEPRYDIDEDPTPVLDPIPNGEYIMLFEDFCLTDKKGNCQPRADRVAASFHIKDNLLHGEAVWYNMQGDTLKHGFYEDGLKVGEWYLEYHNLDYYASNKTGEEYIENGAPLVDTTWMYVTYVKGAAEGPFRKYESSEFPIEEGYYHEGEMSGEWTLRNILYDGPSWMNKRLRKNDVITSHYTIASTDTLVVKFPLIRDGLRSTYGHDRIEYNFRPKFKLKGPLKDLYEFNFAKEEDLELEEEKYNSHEMGGFEDEYYYDEMEYASYSDKFHSEVVTVYDPDRKETFSRGYIIDSIGLIPNYSGVFEEYYPNGQLAYKYEFVNGKLKSEDTIFWDNGNAHDVITFIADSNHYERRIYDYKGKLYEFLVYDSLGDFKRYEIEIDNTEYVYLEGLKGTVNPYGEFISYNADDTLEYELTEPLVLRRTWFKEDSSSIYKSWYEPMERRLTNTNYSVTGSVARRSEKVFSENFENWNGKDTVKFGNLKVVTTASASLYENDFTEPDSIPQRYVGDVWFSYDVTEDQELYLNDALYTGDVEIVFNKGSEIKVGKNVLNISLPKNTIRNEKKLEKKIDKVKEKGKFQDDAMMNYIDPSDYNDDLGSLFFTNFLQDILAGQITYGNTGYSDWYGYDPTPPSKKVTGYMLDGKPHGEWVVYGNDGKIDKIIPFENGEISGMVKKYDVEYPRSDEDDYYWGVERDFGDSLPKKKTYYLSSTSEYKNGKLDGQIIEYNWLGEIIFEENYKEGYRHGKAMERNNLAITKMSYADGAMDGYLRTYLTLPDKDSILLYDLNFQNGSLQGESKAYHMNGNLAKRGFFLSGEPIEDYEAYDTLGFKYHYVKFQYGFPVEEKIWEENELSVRYLFDWQDSIYFEPSDITTSQSLEAMLVDLGFGDAWLEAPYYGRPSLIDKDGVKYHMTKYYPNDTVARDGLLDDGKKIGCWKFYGYEGEKLYEVEYFDSIITINDSIKFKSKGLYTELDENGIATSESYIIEKFEKYDCSHSDHYEIRQFMTVWEANDSLNRMNGYVVNYYDNGTIQSEGEMKDGLPTGFWRIYDPFGKLNQYGEYFMGKRVGRWLSGDLSKTKYLGDICLNPNLPDLEKEIEYRENLLDIVITNYKLGRAIGQQYYDINMNRFKDVEEGTEEVIEE